MMKCLPVPLLCTPLLLAAAALRAHAQHANCDLGTLQSHLAGVQEECCFDDSISDLQENLIAVRGHAASRALPCAKRSPLH